MARLWVKKILDGTRTMEDVPRMLKEQVAELLSAKQNPTEEEDSE